MKTLTLSIKRKYFDEILKGTKKVETREIRPNNAGRYIQYVCEGKTYTPSELDNIPDNDSEIVVEPIKYDALKLLTGAYNIKPRPYIVVEVKGADLVTLTDKSGEPITYICDGEEYVATEIDYHLGEILEDKSMI